MLDEMPQGNASKFVIFYTYENPKLLFPFFISCIFISSLMNALVYVDMANFEAFRQVISSSINILFLKSDCLSETLKSTFFQVIDNHATSLSYKHDSLHYFFHFQPTLCWLYERLFKGCMYPYGLYHAGPCAKNFLCQARCNFLVLSKYLPRSYYLLLGNLFSDFCPE